MSRTAKRLCKGTLGTANATLYTVPASTTSTIISVILANKTAVDATVTLKFASTEIMYLHTIAANDTLILDLKNSPPIIETAELIEGLSGTATAINYYITGVEEV